MTKRLKRIFGFSLFALMLVYWGTSTWYSFTELWRMSDCGLETKLFNDKVIITGIELENYSPILHPGDEILGIRGQGADSARSLLDRTIIGKPGSQTMLLVRCEGKVYEVPVTTQPLPLSRWVREITGTFAPWTFLLTGFIVFLLRYDEHQAWLLAMMLGSFTGLFNAEFAAQRLPFWVEGSALLAHIVGILFFPLFFHFFLLFPERSVLLRRWPQLEWQLYLPFLLVTLPINVLGRLQPLTTPLFARLPEWLGRSLNVFILLTTIGYLCGGMVALVNSYRSAHREARRKLHLVVAGCCAGILNIALIVAVEQLTGGTALKGLYSWLQFLTNFTLPLIPIAFAYAIIKHQVIPISLILRRGMRYVLVSRGSVLLEIAIFTVILSVFLTFFFRWLFAAFRPQSLETLGMTIGVVSASVGIVSWNFTRRLHHKYLAPIIDRKFFRQSYDSHQIITGLAESLRATTEQPKLLEEVATKLQSALQTEAVAILLREPTSGDFVNAYACEYSLRGGCLENNQHKLKLLGSSDVVSYLSRIHHCRRVSELLLPENEHLTLQQLKAELLLPLHGKEQMLGILALGPRLGDLPFSREDEELLMSVVNPVAFAIENARLVEQMIEEARRREEIEAENEARAKELEEARQLQLSMLPRQIPQLPHLEIAAYMKPATEVGGDYYDFHCNGDNVLTIAVGDATGHGLKAGTVVTAVKSLFRTFAPGPDIAAILNQSSRVLKEMNLRSLFMALTVARIEGHRIKIAVAGMPPLLLYRAQTQTVEEVFIKALPLGSVRNYSWREVCLPLSPDDVIVLMSDGFPERFNGNQEMMGYEKASEILQACASLSTQEIIEQFLAAGERWAENQAQDDDITFVVLKVK